MSDKECPNCKNSVKYSNIIKRDIYDKPIKKCHFLEGKHFVVIDKSIMEKLNFFDPENNELYFQQEVTQEGHIILHPYKLE